MSLTVNSIQPGVQANRRLSSTPADAQSGSPPVRESTSTFTASTRLMNQISDASNDLQVANNAASDMQTLGRTLLTVEDHLQAMKSIATDYFDESTAEDRVELSARFDSRRDELGDLLRQTQLNGQDVFEENGALTYDFGIFGGGRATLETEFDIAAVERMSLERGSLVFEEIESSRHEAETLQESIVIFERTSVDRAVDDLELVLRRLEGATTPVENTSVADTLAETSSLQIIADMHQAVLAQGNFRSGNVMDLFL